MSNKLGIIIIFIGIHLGGFGQTNGREVPCTGTQGLIVNFDKETDTIIETDCDSIQILYRYIVEQSVPFVLIGIVTNKSDPNNRLKALTRANRVKDLLMKMGIDAALLNTSTAYHKPPGKDDHHDWPFYPATHPYEIGVYMQVDY